MYVITQKIILEREIWDIIKKRRKKVKEGIYFNVLLPRFVRDREFKNYLGILLIYRIINLTDCVVSLSFKCKEKKRERLAEKKLGR